MCVCVSISMTGFKITRTQKEMEFKHFSHPHGLCFQQMPQGPEIQCSGCNSPAAASSSVYSCWQCNFFLHEQCFQATRSLNHHSHPSHPLSLFPYPTYPSSSFFCNSCNLPGTGFSYSCSTCEFDLHVHCAYMPPLTTTTTHDPPPPYPSFPIPNHSFPHETPSFGPPQYAYTPETATTHESVVMNCPPNPHYTFPNPAMDLSAEVPSAANHPSHVPYACANQHYSFSQETLSFSPPQYAYRPETTTHDSFDNGPNPPSPNEAVVVPSVNAPMGLAGEAVSATNQPPYASAEQHYSFAHESPSFNPQYAYMPETTTHESVIHRPNPQYNSSNEAAPRVNAPMGLAGEAVSAANNQPIHAPYAGANQQYPFSHERPSSNPQYAHMPETTTHESVVNRPNSQYTPSIEAFSTANQPTHAQYAVENQQVPVVNGPKPPNSQPNEALQNSSAQTGLAYEAKSRAESDPPTHVSSAGENRTQPRNVKHFSHHHGFHLSEVQEEDYILCSGCEQHLSGSSYSCSKLRCKFYLHKTCFELPREIQHKSHPKHTLNLLSSPPYKESGEFTCNACHAIGTAFTYHCKDCKFDLHVKCATLPETVKREDHEHPLALLYSSPYKKAGDDSSAEDLIFYCDVCQYSVDESCWVYYCQECDYGTDLHCATAAEDGPEEEATREYSAEAAVAAAQQHIQLLQIKMEMSKQNAQFMTDVAHSLANLV